MVAFRIRRNTAQVRASRNPDDCAVVGCALTAMAALVLMMLAGVAKAEPSDFVFYDLSVAE